MVWFGGSVHSEVKCVSQSKDHLADWLIIYGESDTVIDEQDTLRAVKLLSTTLITLVSNTKTIKCITFCHEDMAFDKLWCWLCLIFVPLLLNTVRVPLEIWQLPKPTTSILPVLFFIYDTLIRLTRFCVCANPPGIEE